MTSSGLAPRDAVSAPTRRVNRGRGHSYVLDGLPVPGPTTILRDGFPSPNLIGWAANETAGYAVDHWDELAEMKVSARLGVLQKARFETRDSAAVRGTDVHTLATRLAAGEEVDAGERVGYVDAYLSFIDEWRPQEILVEVPVFSRRHRYGGTPDLFADLADGRRWLLDWKTAAKGIFIENALQLAAYRYADFYLDDAGAEQPLPEVGATGCVWLRGDGSYELVPVDAGPETFRTFLYVREVAEFVERPRDEILFPALAPPMLEEAPA